MNSPTQNEQNIPTINRITNGVPNWRATWMTCSTATLKWLVSGGALCQTPERNPCRFDISAAIGPSNCQRKPHVRQQQLRQLLSTATTTSCHLEGLGHWPKVSRFDAAPGERGGIGFDLMQCLLGTSETPERKWIH